MNSPAEVLFSGVKLPPALPVVDHYAGTHKLILKALGLQAEMAQGGPPIFDVTCDCEDGAPVGGEREHAHMVAEVLLSSANAYGRAATRVHDVTHPHWRDDLEILVSAAGSCLAYVTFPKPGGVKDVQVQLEALREAERRAGLQREIPAHVLIETHGALREAWEIAALPGVESLDFGLMDFVSAHFGAIPGDAMKSPEQFRHPLVTRAKCEIVTAALAHGLLPSHNVCTELSDPEVIRADAQAARRLGFLRMWSIHPSQILPIVEAMRPDFAKLGIAVEILQAAADVGWGPIRHKDKLHDRASFRYYWQLLQAARTTGMLLPETVQGWFDE